MVLKTVAGSGVPVSRTHRAGPATHSSVDSAQVSTPLQATPSEQLRAVPAQVPALQTSPVVQNWASSQLAPLLSVNAVFEEEGLQLWHWFSGFTWLAP